MIEQSSKDFPCFPEFSARHSKRAAVILAGGDGSRLKALTRLITGDERPKQFCSLIGGDTLLDKTRSRIARHIDTDRTYFSLTQKHERFFRGELADVNSRRMVVQPENKGTAPAIVYSLFRVANDLPEATVAFFPSDHYFSDDCAFMDYVDGAFRAVDREPNAVVLLGIEADKAETSYGWIEPQSSFFGDIPGSISWVKRFWEKPGRKAAARLMANGGLWNSFVMVGKVSAFLRMFEVHQPQMFRMFQAARSEFRKPSESSVIRSIYSWIGDTNFSSDVLERSADVLRVLRVGNVGWSDLGEPARVIGTLNTLGVQTQWMQAMAA